ncbi:sushi domain-containing protein 1 isoform X2 [Protopterus annectens]|uniref:sushi domain-containing protein 1 isoform X2 n=1 Tax=Protopterus annectens TaxID=7888 RepID=UPI001CF9E5D0|nr:sushi domain-containing protein 1 isoform X2 [Protopterus annectens]
MIVSNRNRLDGATLLLKLLLVLILAGVVVSEVEDKNVCASCHANATCFLQPTNKYMCTCNYGFVGNGRTYCQDKDECQLGASKICGEHAFCHNTHGSFYCTCFEGYSASNNMSTFIPNDGTCCVDINECMIADICGRGGLCNNLPGDYECTCEEGYEPENGTVPFHPAKNHTSCKVVDCGYPPPLPNLVMYPQGNTTFGNEVIYQCQKGFTYESGINTSKCSATGRWEGASLVCKAIDCGSPPVVANGIIISNSSTTTLGSLVFYQCREGYFSTGGRNVSICTEDGAWDELSITCREISCGIPSSVPNAVLISNGSTVFGSEAYYQCKSGFHRVAGTNKTVCVSNGEWQNVTLVCEETDCGSPVFVPNAEVMWNGTSKVGSTAEYHCKEGFYSAGKNISVCNSDGEWTKPSLVCKEIDCGSPILVPNADLISNSTRFGSVAHYQCKEGFYPASGRNTSVCMENGEWDNVTLLCKDIDCGSPVLVPYAKAIKKGSTTYGNMVNYQCIEGFYPASGRNSSTCMANGEWENVTLFCREIRCGSPVPVQDAVMLWNGANEIGSTLHYQCKDGFYPSEGSNTSICLGNGDWENATLQCKEIRCGSPVPVPDALMLWNGANEIGSTLHYQCKDGFYPSEGSNTSVCLGNGDWENATLQCKEIRCGSPVPVPDAVMLWNGSNEIGSTVHYQCKVGFYPSEGSNVSICLGNGEWKNATLHCKEIDCGSPVLVPNTVIISSGAFTHGSIVHYQCNHGFYAVSGKNYSVCMQDGLWENVTLLCKEFDCGSPPAVPNTDMILNGKTTFGSFVHYQCKDGFYLASGNNSSVCKQNGLWENITLICKEIDCGSPPAVPNTDLILSGTTTFRSFVHYRCKDGCYLASGSNSSVCMQNGLWENVTLICKAKEGIDDVTLLNDTCLKWKRPTGREGQKGLYLFHVLGHRPYQKDFLHEMTFNFTTTEKTPKKCLDLYFATNYNISITVLSTGDIIKLTIKTQIADPPLPQVDFVIVQSPVATLTLRKSDLKDGPVSCYQVLVFPLHSLTSVNFCSLLSTQTFFSNTSTTDGYVAAQLTLEEISDHFLFPIGDRQYYGEFYNAPLEKSMDYYIVVRIISEWDQVQRHSCAIWAQIKGSSKTVQHVTIVGLGSLGVVFLLLFLSFSMVWCQSSSKVYIINIDYSASHRLLKGGVQKHEESQKTEFVAVRLHGIDWNDGSTLSNGDTSEA